MRRRKVEQLRDRRHALLHAIGTLDGMPICDEGDCILVRGTHTHLIVHIHGQHVRKHEVILGPEFCVKDGQPDPEGAWWGRHPLVEKHCEDLVGEGLAPEGVEERQESLSVVRFLGIMFREDLVEAQRALPSPVHSRFFQVLHVPIEEACTVSQEHTSMVNRQVLLTLLATDSDVE